MIKQIVDVLERLERAVAASQVPDRWWTASDIGSYLSYSDSHVLQRVVCKPDFPKPLRVDDGKPRWSEEEVRAWSFAQRDRKLGRPRMVSQAFARSLSPTSDSRSSAT